MQSELRSLPQSSTTASQGASAPSGSGTRFDVYGVITERICALLEQGRIPWRKPWRSSELLPTNLLSGKAYRGVNVFLLSCAPFASPYWLTFRQARERGGSVRSGEKGFPVIFWRWFDRNEVDGDESDARKRYPVLRYYTVFNAEQCDGIDTPAVTQPDRPHSPIELCEQVVASMPGRPSIEHNGGGIACYRPLTDTVSVPRLPLFESAAEYYNTIFHELGHATGHAKRLGRPGVTDPVQFGSHAYSREELVAEMTAAFLAGHCGLDNSTVANSAAYIGSWLRRLRDDRRLLVTAAAQAQKAADHILGVRYDGVAERDD